MLQRVGVFAGVLDCVFVLCMLYWMMMIKVVKLDCGMSRLCWRGILTYLRVASLVCLVSDFKEPNPF